MKFSSKNNIFKTIYKTVPELFYTLIFFAFILLPIPLGNTFYKFCENECDNFLNIWLVGLLSELLIIIIGIFVLFMGYLLFLLFKSFLTMINKLKIVGNYNKLPITIEEIKANNLNLKTYLEVVLKYSTYYEFVYKRKRDLFTNDTYNKIVELIFDYFKVEFTNVDKNELINLLNQYKSNSLANMFLEICESHLKSNYFEIVEDHKSLNSSLIYYNLTEDEVHYNCCALYYDRFEDCLTVDSFKISKVENYKENLLNKFKN